MKRIAFILNPISGTGHKENIIKYIKKKASEFPDYEISFYTTKGAGEALFAAKGYAGKGYDTVVAIGGDGTVNEVAKGLVYTSSKLGIIPVGSGNGLARHLKIPLNYQNAVDAIFNGKTQFIDAGRINEEIFFCTAGVGFDAVIGERFNSAGTRGFITYIEFSVKEYIKYRPEVYELDINGNKFKKKAFLITFANSSQWGNDVYIAPDANISDGMMDVVIWRDAPKITMPILTAGLLFKTLKYSEFVDTYRCKEMTIRRESDGLIQFDGESKRMGRELHMSVLSKAVEIIVPQEWAPFPQLMQMVMPIKELVPKIIDMVK